MLFLVAIRLSLLSFPLEIEVRPVVVLGLPAGQHHPGVHQDTEEDSLTLFGVSLVLWRRKADSALSHPCFMTLPPNFTTSEFPISNYFTFKHFC